MKYIPKMNAALDKTMDLNPENLLSYYFRTITLPNMPKQFGGREEVARSVFEKAKEKFDKFEPASPIHPDWEKEINEMEMEKL